MWGPTTNESLNVDSVVQGYVQLTKQDIAKFPTVILLVCRDNFVKFVVTFRS